MPRPRRMSRSSIEALERRICPSVTVAQVDLDSDGSADDLRIIGGNEGTKIRITDEGVGQGSMLLDLDINGDGDFADPGDLQGALLEVVDDTSVIQIQLGGGNDSVEYVLADAFSTSVRRLSVDLGKGNDSFTFLGVDQGIGNGSFLSINVQAGAGNDSLTAVLPHVVDSQLLINGEMGAGNDRVGIGSSSSNAPVFDLGAVVDIEIDLGKGTNSLFGELYGFVGVIEQATVRIDVVGGSGIDTVEMFTQVPVGDGFESSTFEVTVDLGGGNDSFAYFSSLEIEDNSSSLVRVLGGSGNDFMLVGYTASEATTLDGLAEFELLGGAGTDEIHSSFSDASSRLLLTGQLLVTLNGGDGIDIVDAVLKLTTISTGNYSLVALGGNGKDRMTVDVQTAGFSVLFGSAGRLLINGGQQVDTLTAIAPAPILDVQLVETFL